MARWLSRMKTKTRIWLGVVAGLVLAFGVLAGVKAAQVGTMIEAGKSFAPPPESVASAPVKAVEWEQGREAIASLVAVRGVTLGAEVPGLVREIDFESGAAVKRGAVLVRLDTSAEEAQLAAALAEASLAELSLERARSLRQAGSSSQADLDAAEARARQTRAAVDTLRANIA